MRAAVDVDAGNGELATLLGGWRSALERTVKRATPEEASSVESSDSSQRAAQTVRYEEVALAFDEDDVPDDGPTFEAHALPSDSALLVAMPTAEDDPLAATADTVALPPTPLTPLDRGSADREPEREITAAVPTEVAVPFGLTGPAKRVLAVVAFVAVGIVAVLLATLVR